MGTSSKQKTSKDIAELNGTSNQLDKNDNHRLLHPRTVENSFFSSSHKIFTKIDHIMAIKHTLRNLKNRNHTTSAINHNGIKLEISNRKITGKIPKYVESKKHASK